MRGGGGAVQFSGPRATTRVTPDNGTQVTLLFVAQGDIHHFDTSPMGPRTSLLGLKAPDIHVFARPEGADSADGEASTRAQTLKGTSMRGDRTLRWSGESLRTPDASTHSPQGVAPLRCATRCSGMRAIVLPWPSAGSDDPFPPLMQIWA